MKSLLLISILVFANSAFSAELTSYFNSNVDSFSQPGFADSGFNIPNAVCYKGDVNEVCAEVSKSQKLTEEEYNDGGHGYIDTNSCTVRKNLVFVNYNQLNDWENTLNIERVVTPCYHKSEKTKN